MNLSIEAIKKAIPLILGVIGIFTVLLVGWWLLQTVILWSLPKIPAPKLLSAYKPGNFDSTFELTATFDTGELFTQPTVLQNKAAKTFSPSEARAFSQKLGFNSAPFLNGSVFTWSASSSDLSIDSERGELTFKDKSLTEQNYTKGSLPSPANAKAAFKNLYNSLGLSKQLVDLDNPNITYAVRTSTGAEKGDIPQANVLTANFITLTFPFKVKEKPLFGIYPARIQAVVTYARDQKLFALSLPLLTGTWEEFSSYPSLSKDQIGSIVRSKKAYQVSLQRLNARRNVGDSFGYLDLRNLASGYLKSEAGYPYLLPIYIVSGEGTTPDGAGLNGVFYLPAFSDKFLKK